jgi:hypothetical protein
MGDGAAMVEVLQDQQALLDDRVRFAALDVGDEANAAGVVFVLGRVQTEGLGFGNEGIGVIAHVMARLLSGDPQA